MTLLKTLWIEPVFWATCEPLFAPVNEALIVEISQPSWPNHNDDH
jgi:hypothetical protein